MFAFTGLQPVTCYSTSAAWKRTLPSAWGSLLLYMLVPTVLNIIRSINLLVALSCSVELTEDCNYKKEQKVCVHNDQSSDIWSIALYAWRYSHGPLLATSSTGKIRSVDFWSLCALYLVFQRSRRNSSPSLCQCPLLPTRYWYPHGGCSKPEVSAALQMSHFSPQQVKASRMARKLLLQQAQLQSRCIWGDISTDLQVEKSLNRQTIRWGHPYLFINSWLAMVYCYSVLAEFLFIHILRIHTQHSNSYFVDPDALQHSKQASPSMLDKYS